MTMRWKVSIPRDLSARKPPHGHACTRCGVCCIASICPLGAHVFRRRRGPCPALLIDDERNASCGLVVEPQKYATRRVLMWGLKTMSDAAAMLVGAGTGCDARINGEQANEPFYQKLRIWDRKNKDTVALAKKIWGI